MKKTLFTALRAMCVGAMTLFAVSCYDDSALWGEVDRLDGRIDSLATELNNNIKAANDLAASMKTLETSLTQAIADGDAAIKKALEEQLATVKTSLEKAISDGDLALADALAKEKKAIETAITNLQNGLTSVTGSVETLQTALATLEATLGAKYTEILTTMDAADKALDGKITNLDAAIEAVKKEYVTADTELSEELVEKIAEAVAKITVTNVKEENGKVILTLADGSTIEVSKPLANVDNEGLVTTIEVDSVKYWAVVVNGEAQSLNVPVGASVELEFRITEGVLEYSINGEDWLSTGAYVSDSEPLIFDFYQGSEFDYDLWEEVADDYYTLVFGEETYYLPLYKVDNSVVTIKAGKTYFQYEESKTVDVVMSDVTAMYVMTKPDGWKAKLDGKKLTVTAPAEANVTSGVAEADGEVLLHCTTTEGKCKIARLAVATTEGFSLTVTEDGAVKIVNPEVVTSTTMWGDVYTDFNDAYIGLAPVAAFEASPEAYVSAIQDNYNDMYTYINNWKTNTAEMDEDWNTIYTIGGAYVEGEYEIDVIESTVPKMYSDWTYGQEMPKGSRFVVWACPMDESGMPRTADLVYGYYSAPISAEIKAVENGTTVSDVEVTVEVVGAESYYVGLVAEEYMYGFSIDEYMQMQEGPFGYFQMALQYGMPEYAFQNMGVLYDAENEMPATINASDIMGGSLMPEMKVYMWVFPVVDGMDLADYTYEKNMKPYIYEFTTNALQPGGSATVTFGEENLQYTSMSVELSASEGTTMIYYKWYNSDDYNAITDYTADLLENGYASAELPVTAQNGSYAIAPGNSFTLVALAVDSEGKYGEVAEKSFETPTITYSETFTATFGDETSTVFYSGFKYDFTVNVTGGEAAKYYYVFSTTEFTDEQLANLPLVYDYNYNFRSGTALTGLYANAESTYYLAVVVESTDGELSPVIKKTVVVPAVPAAE